MKKNTSDYISIPIKPEELIAIRELLETLFAKVSNDGKERERIAIFEKVFQNDYSSQMGIYILEQLYDKIIRIKVSIFDTELPNLKITQMEAELLYLISSNLLDIDDFVFALKQETKWRYFDKELALLVNNSQHIHQLKQ